MPFKHPWLGAGEALVAQLVAQGAAYRSPRTPSAPAVRTQWPFGNGLVDSEALLAPLRLVLRRAGVWKQRDPVPPIAYRGYPGGAEHVAPIDFSPDAVAYNAERGRSVLDMALAAAFLLGVEQGQRMQRARVEELLPVLRAAKTVASIRPLLECLAR